MKKFRFFSVILAVLVTLVGFTALRPVPVSAGGGNNLEIISPDGGTYKAGETIIFHWQHPLAATEKTVVLNIDIFNSIETDYYNPVERLVKEQFLNTGLIDGRLGWKVPAEFPNGTYIIQIEEVMGNYHYFGQKKFVIATPAITILPPQVNMQFSGTLSVIETLVSGDILIQKFSLRNVSQKDVIISAGFLPKEWKPGFNYKAFVGIPISEASIPYANDAWVKSVTQGNYLIMEAPRAFTVKAGQTVNVTISAWTSGTASIQAVLFQETHEGQIFWPANPPG